MTAPFFIEVEAWHRREEWARAAHAANLLDQVPRNRVIDFGGRFGAIVTHVVAIANQSGLRHVVRFGTGGTAEH